MEDLIEQVEDSTVEVSIDKSEDTIEIVENSMEKVEDTIEVDEKSIKVEDSMERIEVLWKRELVRSMLKIYLLKFY